MTERGSREMNHILADHQPSASQPAALPQPADHAMRFTAQAAGRVLLEAELGGGMACPRLRLRRIPRLANDGACRAVRC